MALAFGSVGVVLLALCALSLWHGRTIGLYGVVETRATIFYWMLVAAYGGLGALSVIFAVRTALR